MSLRKVALHLDISPWLILVFFGILEYRLVLDLNICFHARYLLLSFIL